MHSQERRQFLRIDDAWFSHEPRAKVGFVAPARESGSEQSFEAGEFRDENRDDIGMKGSCGQPTPEADETQAVHLAEMDSSL